MFFPVPRKLCIGTQHIQKGSVHSFHQAIYHGVVGCSARLSDLEGPAMWYTSFLVQSVLYLHIQ